MTVEDLLTIPATALATILAAVVAAMTVLLSSFINARTARLVARDSFRRQLIHENVKPFLDGLNNQIEVYSRLTEMGTQVSNALDAITTTKLADINKSPTALDPLHDRQKALVVRLEELHEQLLNMRRLWNSTSGMSVINRDQRLVDTATVWLSSVTDSLTMLSGNVYGMTSNTDQVAAMKKAARVVLWKAVALRIRLEEFVIQPPNWLSRSAYKMKRRLKGIWRKIKLRDQNAAGTS